MAGWLEAEARGRAGRIGPRRVPMLGMGNREVIVDVMGDAARRRLLCLLSGVRGREESAAEGGGWLPGTLAVYEGVVLGEGREK